MSFVSYYALLFISLLIIWTTFCFLMHGIDAGIEKFDQTKDLHFYFKYYNLSKFTILVTTLCCSTDMREKQ